MNRIFVNNEDAFSVPTRSFAIGASTNGYTLAFSVDGTTFTEYDEATDAGKNCIINGATKGLYYKLVGNVGSVQVAY